MRSLRFVFGLSNTEYVVLWIGRATSEIRQSSVGQIRNSLEIASDLEELVDLRVDERCEGILLLGRECHWTAHSLQRKDLACLLQLHSIGF